MSKVRGEGCCLYRSVGGRTDPKLLVPVCWGGGLTLSCSYRSVGGGSLVKCQRLGRGATLMATYKKTS